MSASVAGRSRLLVAYFVTTQVALSYFMLGIARRFRRPEAVERLTAAKHRKNARRIEAAILRLRGLFIKVGQLISIMANFLPDAFREELQRLQDRRGPAGTARPRPSGPASPSTKAGRERSSSSRSGRARSTTIAGRRTRYGRSATVC